ncbi:hypothetical protein CVT24_012994 [Panaeolus cyanescens]|uniref:Uncharacterized protein n=1 Tax=Panaeolus cyanescens TaxID=181874 RepID=A0A409WA54_9AGAR|nr:hypothetical protein CVT24_012994 [Panaeolus cyanescens]
MRELSRHLVCSKLIDERFGKSSSYLISFALSESPISDATCSGPATPRRLILPLSSSFLALFRSILGTATVNKRASREYATSSSFKLYLARCSRVSTIFAIAFED